jgi:hypothetical protein
MQYTADVSKRQSHRFSSGVLISTFVVLAGCGAEPAGLDGDGGRGANEADAGDDQRGRCRAPAGVTNAPNSVSQVVELLNALPKPVTLPCFLESLARPLALHAANSEFSAQPAVGARSPRIFLFIDPLVLSIAPAGAGAQLLEFGEQRSAGTSLKAELEFPITEQLDAEAPYRRLAFAASVSACGVCHQGERLAEDVGSSLAFISPALRPLPIQRVPISKLIAELDSCDPGQEPDRCALLDALLSQRPAPLEREFSPTLDTFF